MSPCLLQLFWISVPYAVVITSLLVPLEVQAQQNVSSNSGNYEFGWIVEGVHDPNGLPTCGQCFNIFYDTHVVGAWVGTYPCCSLLSNEIWAYENSTNSIAITSDENDVFNLTQKLCLDALRNGSLTSNYAYYLGLSLCNSSVESQQWTLEGNHVRSGLTDSGGHLYLWSPDY